MKALMILGAIVGFLIGVGLGLATGCSWSTTLWRACAAALGTAVLTRWWGGIWLSSLKDALENPPAAPHAANPPAGKPTNKV